MSRLVVTGGRFHRYALDGERLPTVTGIIGKGSREAGPPPVGGEVVRDMGCRSRGGGFLLGDTRFIYEATKEPDRVRDASATAGKQVHSIAERLVFGQPVESYDPTTTEPYPDDVVRMGEQVARFMDRWDVQPDTALVERPVFNDELRYAGTFDLVARLRGGDTWLIDYKTGASGIYPETVLQLTAYKHATHIVTGEDDKPMPHVTRCAALWVRPDYWELVPVRSDDVPWQAFLSAMRVAEFASMRLEDVVGAALPVPGAA